MSKMLRTAEEMATKAEERIQEDRKRWTVHYRVHNSNRTRYRIWRTHWGGMFEIIEKKEFKTLERMCKLLNIPIQEHLDD